MKHYWKSDGSVWAFESDGSQDEYITGDMSLMTQAEIAAHLAPAPTPIPSSLSMKQARLALLAAGHLDAVQAGISAMPRASQIAWEFAATVDRGDPLTATLSAALGLDAVALDALFTAGAAL